MGGDGCESDCTDSDDVLPLWELELGGPTGFVDVGSGVAFDSVGNLIVAAYTEPDVIWIRKYDTDYNELWTVTYPGIPGTVFSTTRVAVDGSDNIGFVGEIPDAGISIMFGMLDPAGGELWTQTFGTAVGGNIAFDPDGNVLLSAAFIQASNDLWVAKYDPLGVLFWSDVFDGTAGTSDVGRAVASDAAGNVFVAGEARSPGPATDIFIRKYDPNGAVLWTDIVNGAADQTDFGTGLAIAANGDVVVGGVIREVPIWGDAWLRRYEPDGTPVWTQTYAGTAGEGDGIADVSASADGTFAVCGVVTDVGGIRYWLAKVDADGQIIWERRRVGSGSWSDVAVSLDGRVAVAGTVLLPFPWDAEARFAVYPF